MGNPGVSKERADLVVETVNQCLKDGFAMTGTPAAAAEAARRLGMADSSVHSVLRAAKRKHGLAPDASLKRQEVPLVPEDPELPEDFHSRLMALLRGKRKSLAEITTATHATSGQILDAVDELRGKGVNIHRAGDAFEIPSHVEHSWIGGAAWELTSGSDNTFLFGAIGDLHAGSKYCRWDVREDMYRQYVEAGVQCVFDTGNWIDGEASFNRYDIEAHGLDAQCQLLADRHPKHKGLHTLAVWGDDHEGWYVQREGVDVGRYCEDMMRDAGHQWTNLGFMEAHVTLINANTGKRTNLAVVHPGGGSAYALSYSIQKIVESYEGGEKPAVGLYGHYHKLWAGLIRNVWVAQTGCAQDQTPFMRKKRLEAHVGGCLIALDQDPETGAIISMTPKLIRYFNKGYYSGRWSKHGEVILPERSTAAIR